MYSGDLRDPKANASFLIFHPQCTQKADATLESVFSFAQNLTPHCALVDIREIFIDHDIALFPGNFMLTHICLT